MPSNNIRTYLPTYLPVVRDGHDGAAKLFEEVLEPGDRLGVQVVRRLCTFVFVFVFCVLCLWT